MFDFCVSSSIKPVKFGTLKPGDAFTETPISSMTHHTFVYMKASIQTAFINNVVNLNNGCCSFWTDEEEVLPIQVENVVMMGE